MNDQIERESCIHGNKWDTLHNGYFSDPVIAAPFIEVIKKVATQLKPDVIADLGGGTGFISGMLAASELNDISFIDIDHSGKQLKVAKKNNIKTLYMNIKKFARNDIADAGQKVLFIMRSALHYFGQKGMPDLLEHLRKQARAGEYFVHQSASFEKDVEANCLNRLYKLMHTKKWYPSESQLSQNLKNNGWKVEEKLNAPPLFLTSDDLATRYTLEDKDLKNICQELTSAYPTQSHLFKARDHKTFDAWLHYKIFVCKAV